MANYLRILYSSVHTKLIILSLALVLTTALKAQQVTSASAVVSQVSPQENIIDVYPNPAVEYIQVQITNSTLENIEFELHSIIGNMMSIEVIDLGQGKYRIPVKNFATGYYFVVVKDEEMRFKRAYKFLKD